MERKGEKPTPLSPSLPFLSRHAVCGYKRTSLERCTVLKITLYFYFLKRGKECALKREKRTQDRAEEKENKKEEMYEKSRNL